MGQGELPASTKADRQVLSGEPRNTIAAQLGIVPEEREANAKEIARIWLLCYVSDTHLDC